MKHRTFKLLLLGIVAAFTTILPNEVSAQTNNSPARLAIISESSAAVTVIDLLTVELSAKPYLQLLERAQIEKIYREQGLSAGNKDVLKLGQVLGADGLLLLTPVSEGTNQFMQVRLVAVKPGVVIVSVRSVWPVQDVSAWSHWLANHFTPLLQKLSVPVRDAIPISVVNLRSATRSTGAQETERQLTSLVTERLTRERELFVLERRRMDLLSTEKELQGMGESSFWNGSYLLEGTIDRDGYSKETVTVDARLIPPQNGRGIEISIKGPRENLGEVIERLVAQILVAMRKPSSAVAWQPEAEAANYFAEAGWALKWGMIPEARAAADAAWALGKRDLAGALMRGRTHVAGVVSKLTPYEGTRTTFSPAYNRDGLRVSVPPSEARIQASINSTLATYPLGGVYKRTFENRRGSTTVDFALFIGLPEIENIERAKHALELYLEFCKTSPEGQAEFLSRGKHWNDGRNSDWYALGIEALVAASRVLQNFYYVAQSDPSVMTSLTELRGLTRLVATTISESPTVRDSYFVGGRIATHDELTHTMGVRPNIFLCMVAWGCFWQERPEDTLKLYRKLMQSAVFCYIHKGLWDRGVIQPRLIAWNENDRKRLPLLWDDFMRELNGSTNPLLQMEAKALARADATDEESVKKDEQEWWDVVRSNRAALVANNVDLFYLGWSFISNAETEAMAREYWDKTVPALKVTSAFDEQKKFLREFQPYEFQQFVKIFREKLYTRVQAQELQPLIAAYKSNLLAQAERADASQKRQLQRNARSVDTFLGNTVEKILNPPITAPPPVAASAVIPPAQPRPAKRLESPAENFAPATNIINVKKFLEIPLQGLDEDTISAIGIRSHRLLGGQLLLDLEISRAVHSFSAQEKWKGTHYATIPAIAILDIKTERWQVIECAEIDVVNKNPFYYHTTLWRGNVFTSQGGNVSRYDSTAKAWIELDLPGLGNCGLFVVGDRMFAAARELIVEVLDQGASMRILASSRRQPPVSALDTESFAGNGFALGTPAFFGDSVDTLRVVTAKKIFAWQGADWKGIAASPPVSRPLWIAEDHVLFFGDGWNTPAGIWRLATGDTNAEYYLGQERTAERSLGQPPASNTSKPIWEMPPGLMLAQLPATSRGKDLYLLMDHAKEQNIVNEREHVIIGTRILPQDGYHAALLCFARNHAAPQKVYLKFDDGGGVLPVSGNPNGNGRMISEPPEGWLCFAAGRLYLGRESSGISYMGARTGALPKVGVWVTSLQEIDAEIDSQKKSQVEWQTQKAVASEQTARGLWEKFDGNRDGRMDGDEKESALADEIFVVSQLNQIDTNQNSWLDAGELKFFDANKNETLDGKEQIGISHAQHLLAVKLLRRYDPSGDGFLDRREFDDLLRSALDPSSGTRMVGWIPDDNRDNQVDVEELQAFCEQQTMRGLQIWSMPGRPFMPQSPPSEVKTMDANQRFKSLVDEFWRNGGTNSVPQPYRPGFGPATVPPHVQQP